jgi:RHS repeat-associated protein
MCGWGSRSRRPRATRIYTLLPSALGGIISIREVNATGPNTDTWLGYDRLGSVCLTTDASGASNGLRWQDAYGNQLASVDTGAWASAGASEGYGLTTKWYDGDAEFYCFNHRSADPQTGRFVSIAPFPPSLEHPYLYAQANPVFFVDPYGTGPNIGRCCNNSASPHLACLNGQGGDVGGTWVWVCPGSCVGSTYNFYWFSNDCEGMYCGNTFYEAPGSYPGEPSSVLTCPHCGEPTIDIYISILHVYGPARPATNDRGCGGPAARAHPPAPAPPIIAASCMLGQYGSFPYHDYDETGIWW